MSTLSRSAKDEATRRPPKPIRYDKRKSGLDHIAGTAWTNGERKEEAEYQARVQAAIQADEDKRRNRK